MADDFPLGSTAAITRSRAMPTAAATAAGGLGVVARDHPDLEPAPDERAHHAGGFRSHRVREPEQAEQLAPSATPTTVRPARSSRVRSAASGASVTPYSSSMAALPAAIARPPASA
jgi:hypothetical protein